MLKTDFFWTDVHQAIDRLSGTVVLYDDIPHYVAEIQEGTADNPCPRGIIIPCGSGTDKKLGHRKLLNSPHFKRFREPINLGWVNPITNVKLLKQAYYIERNPIRARVHGLTSNNISVKKVIHNTDELGFCTPFIENVGGHLSFLTSDEGIIHTHKKNFPNMQDILKNIQSKEAIAYNNQYCIACNQFGTKFLYRQTTLIGIIQDTTNVLLLQKRFGYLRDEIMEDETFTLNAIQEI